MIKKLTRNQQKKSLGCGFHYPDQVPDKDDCDKACDSFCADTNPKNTNYAYAQNQPQYRM